jgi:hypothetical protein
MKILLSTLFIFALILNVNTTKFMKAVNKCVAISSFGCARDQDCCASTQKKKVICWDMARRVTLAGKNSATNMCADSNPFGSTAATPQMMTFASPNNIGGFLTSNLSNTSNKSPVPSTSQTKTSTPQIKSLGELAAYAASLNSNNASTQSIKSPAPKTSNTNQVPKIKLLSDLANYAY